jgi:hypothetical protein
MHFEREAVTRKIEVLNRQKEIPGLHIHWTIAAPSREKEQ